MKIAKKDFKLALETAINGCRSQGGDLIADTSNFLFKEGTIYSWSTAISVRMKLPADCMELEGVIKGEDLLKIVSRVKATEFEIECLENEWKISTDTMKAVVRKKEDTVSDRISSLLSEKLVWETLPENFYDAMRVSFISNNSTAYEGVFMYEDYMYATDTIRMCKAQLKNGSIKEPTLLGRNSISSILSLGIKFNEVAISKTWVHFRKIDDDQESAVLSCNRLDEYAVWYPKMYNGINSILSRAKDTDAALSATFPPLGESIALTQIFSNEVDNNKSVINITLSSKFIEVSSAKVGQGNIKEKLKWPEGKNPDIDNKIVFSITSDVLNEVMKHTKDFYLAQVKASKDRYRTLLVFKGENFITSIITVEGK